MTLWDSLKHLRDRDADKLLYVRIAPERVDRARDGQTVQAGRHYLRFRLVEMYLKKRVEWFQSWYPAVHSVVRFDFGARRIEVPFIADATRLAVSRTGAEDIVARNFLLTPAVPFNGGTVDLDAGLMAMHGANYLGDFVKILGNFAGVLAVPQLSAVLTVAEPLAAGIQDLLSSVGDHLHLGLHESYAAQELIPGYFAVVRATEHQVDPAQLWVRGDQLRYGRSEGESEPLQSCDHMLFRLETFEQRDDWESLTDIYAPFQDARRALRDFDEQRASFFLRTALVRALEAPELTAADRRRVIATLKEQFELEKTTFGVSGLVGNEDATLKDLMRQAMPVDRAIELGDVSFSEIMGEL
ncbi:MAG TPA: hypothetical protein VGJ60_19590 [Chloroflexota bacterium]